MSLPIFAEVHGFSYEPCHMISESEIHSFEVGCMYMSFQRWAKQFNHFFRAAIYSTLKYANYFIVPFIFHNLSIFEIRRWNSTGFGFLPIPLYFGRLRDTIDLNESVEKGPQSSETNTGSNVSIARLCSKSLNKATASSIVRPPS